MDDHRFCPDLNQANLPYARLEHGRPNIEAIREVLPHGDRNTGHVRFALYVQSDWHLALASKNGLLAMRLPRSVRCHEPQHLHLQLRIHLVRDGHNIGKEQAEFQTVRVFLERGKYGDLQ